MKRSEGVFTTAAVSAPSSPRVTTMEDKKIEIHIDEDDHWHVAVRKPRAEVNGLIDGYVGCYYPDGAVEVVLELVMGRARARAR